MAPFIDSSLLLLSLPGLFSANPGGRANVSQKCSPTFLSFRHTWRLRSLFVISPWMPPSQQALFAQSLNWLGTEVPPSLPDPWTPADPLPPALHRSRPWMEIKAVLRFPLKRALRAMRSLPGDCARTLGGPFASMLGGQSLMMVGVASRHCDPHCLGEVLGETLFEATLDPPSPLRSPDTCSGSVWCPPQGGGDQLQHKCGLLWPSLSHHLVTHSCHRWRRRPPTSSLDRSPLVGARRGASRPASQQIVEQAHLRGDQTRPREQTSQPWSSPADRSNRICWFSSAGVCLPVLGKLLLLITWSQGDKEMLLFQFSSHVEIGRMQKRAKMMKGEAVKPLRHNVNCSAAIFGRPQLGHFKAQGRAIFSPKFSKKILCYPQLHIQELYTWILTQKPIHERNPSIHFWNIY